MALWACVLCACQQELSALADVEPALKTAAVVGGKEVTTCQYPSTVSIGGCTGTLIHPRVVTTAAHCLSSETATIRFGGAGRNAAGSFTVEGRCTSGARGGRGGGASGDWGYCVLPEDERVKKLPITPPLVGCEAERYLKAGALGWIVGYGTTGPEGRGQGVKRAVEVKINRVSDGTIDVGDREVGACHGDSGGPIYMQLTDGANDYGLRVLGSTSGPGAAFCDCTCSTLYVDIAMHVKAIEENEDIDVTPCTDAEGNWAPGPECNAIQTQAMMGSGTFPECSVGRTSAPINSCGMMSASAAGTGGSVANAGSAAMASAGAGAAAAGAPMAAAGAGAAAGASGATVPAAASGSAQRAPDAGAAVPGAAPGVGAAGAGAAPRAGAGAIVTGTSTQGVSAAATAALAALPASGAMVPTEEDGGGCSVASSPRLGSPVGALFGAASAVWLTFRRRWRSNPRGARSLPTT